MRILLLTSRLPFPPNRGDRLRVYNFVKTMAQQHELFLISFINDDREEDNLPHLREFFQKIVLIPKSRFSSLLTVGLNLWRPEPLQVLYYRSKKMRQAVEKGLNEWNIDLIYTHLFRMAPYAVDAKNTYNILDLTDAISLEIARSLPYRRFISRIIYGMELDRIKHYEQGIASEFDECWLISQTDVDEIAQGHSDHNFVVISNGVDLLKFHPIPGIEEPGTIAFVGHLGVFHNIDAARFLVQEVLPLVETSFASARLEIIGADPVDEIRALQKPDKVIIPGFVSDLNVALNRAAIFIAPLRFAAGVQNKVLEAMAAGRAVITTSIVAEGMKAIPGRDLLVADSAPEIAALAVDLLNFPDKRRALGERARSFVEVHFNWNVISQRLNMIESAGHKLLNEKQKGKP